MQNIRELPACAAGDRIETGAIRFGNDWPGLFIRGDDTFALAAAIRRLDPFWRRHVDELKADPNLSSALGTLHELIEMIERDVIVD